MNHYPPDIWKEIKKRYTSYGGNVSIEMLKSWMDELSGERTSYSLIPPKAPSKEAVTQTQAGIEKWSAEELKKIEERMRGQIESLQKNIAGKYSYSWQPDTSYLESIAGEIRGLEEQYRPWREQYEIYRDVWGKVGNDPDLGPNVSEDWFKQFEPYGFKPSFTSYDERIDEIVRGFRGWLSELSEDTQNWWKQFESEGRPIEQKLMSLQEAYSQAQADIAGQAKGAIGEQAARERRAAQELMAGQESILKRGAEEQKVIGSQAQARKAGAKEQVARQIAIEEEQKKQKLLRYRR